jgi:hypothetical protein
MIATFDRRSRANAGSFSAAMSNFIQTSSSAEGISFEWLRDMP